MLALYSSYVAASTRWCRCCWQDPPGRTRGAGLGDAAGAGEGVIGLGAHCAKGRDLFNHLASLLLYCTKDVELHLHELGLGLVLSAEAQGAQAVVLSLVPLTFVPLKTAVVQAPGARLTTKPTGTKAHGPSPITFLKVPSGHRAQVMPAPDGAFEYP